MKKITWKWWVVIGVSVVVIGKVWVLTSPLNCEAVINFGLATVILSCFAGLFKWVKRDKKPKERVILGIYRDPDGHARCIKYAPSTPTEKFLHWLQQYLP